MSAFKIPHQGRHFLHKWQESWEYLGFYKDPRFALTVDIIHFASPLTFHFLQTQ